MAAALLLAGVHQEPEADKQNWKCCNQIRGTCLCLKHTTGSVNKWYLKLVYWCKVRLQFSTQNFQWVSLFHSVCIMLECNKTLKQMCPGRIGGTKHANELCRAFVVVVLLHESTLTDAYYTYWIHIARKIPILCKTKKQERMMRTSKKLQHL